MKKILTALLLTVMATQSMATDKYEYIRHDSLRSSCKAAALSFFISNDLLVKTCSGYIPAQGVISQGKHKGSTWEKAYPKGWFIDINDNAPGESKNVRLMSTKGGKKVCWKIIEGSKQFTALRTKEIALSNLDDYLARNNIDRTKT